MKKGTILKNLWAGYETYFIYLRPVSIFRGVTCYEILLPLVERGAVND